MKHEFIIKKSVTIFPDKISGKPKLLLCVDDFYLVEYLLYLSFDKYWKDHLDDIYIIKRSIYTIARIRSNFDEKTYDQLHICMKSWIQNISDDMPKFDYIIQNPPYNGSLHLAFFKAGYNMLADTGKMVIIEPATWLINIRKNGNTVAEYNKIKRLIHGKIKSVTIENLNKNFNTCMHVPFSITVIDKSKTYSNIEFTCCGEKKTVKSIYDCNLVGNYITIWNILGKCKKYGDLMKDHVWKSGEEDKSFITFMDICASPSNKNATSRATPDSETWFTSVKDGDFFISYIGVSFHPKYEITNTPQYSFKACGNSATNKNYSSKHSTQVFGTEKELNNWKYYNFNNKLPLFLNILLTIDQHNNSKPYIPWIVDKIYTDREIYDKLKFTPEEIKLIETTVKKYERHSLWFKRYMCGPTAVLDKEVQKFIDEINA